MEVEQELPAPALEKSPEATNGSSAPEIPSNANSLKRKQSPSPSPDASSKKRRLSTDITAEASSSQSRSNGGASASPALEPPSKAGTEASSTTSHAPPSPTLRKPTKAIDERKRGQRLFGAAFAALGVNPSTNLSKRREIERKQREKLRAQAEEDDAAREERVAKLRGIRGKEQRRFDAEGVRIRQANMRAMAHSLRTKAEPRLYWRPWELRPEEEDIIKEQLREAEAVIAEEMAESERRDGNGKGDEGVRGDDGQAARLEPAKDDQDMQDADGDAQAKDTPPDEAKQDEAQDRIDVQEETPVAEKVDGSASKPDAEKPASPPGAEDDTGNTRKDDMDEGAEDDQGDDAVIY